MAKTLEEQKAELLASMSAQPETKDSKQSDFYRKKRAQEATQGYILISAMIESGMLNKESSVAEIEEKLFKYWKEKSEKKSSVASTATISDMAATLAA